jgi:hypothetical protein
LLIAVARAWNEFDPTNPIRLVYLGGLVGTLAAIGVLALWMRLRTRAFPRPT